ncbi:exo-alpha-sialidase [Azospirillum sp. ST 5-10]|uniref:exo-alpha-sialidase n=1 Tax=unclassified Azospirillum TaxID=2630922 RepID=UPI003F4A42ED
MGRSFSLSHRIVYRDPVFFASFPSVATRTDGVTLVAFRRARDHRWLRGEAYRSSDTGFDNVDHLDARSQIVIVPVTAHGDPAGEPVGVPPDPQAADQDANLLVLRDGRLLLTGFSWYPLPAKDGEALRALGVGVVGSPQRTGDLYLFWGAYARWSDDGGRTWSPHRFLPPLPGQPEAVPGVRPLYGGAVRGRVVEAQDGTLLLTSYAHHPDTGQYASHLFASTDRGENWSYRSVIAVDREACRVGFCETALHLAGDGRLLALHRTTGLDDRLAVSTSRDQGRSWEPWRRHEVVGHPYDACALTDGRVLLVYGYRHPPFGVRARVWDPAAGEPEDAAEIVLRDDSPSADVGYPWATALPDGRALVVYYICDGTGVRHIAATLIEPG